VTDTKTTAGATTAAAPPAGAGASTADTFRALHVVRRNFLVWRKLMFSSLVGNLVDPLIFLVGLGYGLGKFLPQIQGIPYVNFLAGGMLCYSTMNSASFEALWSAYSRLAVQRTWEGILQAPMTVRDVVVGEWLWAACKSLLSGSAILLVMYALGVVEGFAPLAVLPVVMLIGICFAGIALVVTSLARSYDFFTYYFTLVITPMMFLSGVFFPRDSLPAAVQVVGALLPLSHGIDLVRGITLGRPVEQPLLHAAVLLAWGLGGVWLATRIATRRLAK
jgi:lipooligosaccharide transport system permease protein